jgi:hypothetical protein
MGNVSTIQKEVTMQYSVMFSKSYYVEAENEDKATEKAMEDFIDENPAALDFDVDVQEDD